jgi:RNA polymerase sigma-70 factor (ECF subfamily)
MAIEQAQEPHDPGVGPSPPETWLDEHGDALFRYARSRVGTRELAEDLVQETLLSALGAWSRFEGRSSVRTWLLAILRRKIIDHCRRMSATETVSTAEDGLDPSLIRDRFFNASGTWKDAPLNWETPDKVSEFREFWDVFHGCLSRLPASLATVFILRELEGMTMEEVCEALELTEGNLRVRLHRARLMLRECLEKNWFADAPNSTRRPR